MEQIGQYIISVTAAAVLCAIIGSLLEGKSAVKGLTKLICGIFLAFVVVRPLAEIEIRDPSDFWEEYSGEAEHAASQGTNIAREAMAAIITEQTAAYILDKGAEFGVELTVTVSLDADNIPACVTIGGMVPPAAKAVLQESIEEELGISKENQIWTD